MNCHQVKSTVPFSEPFVVDPSTLLVKGITIYISRLWILSNYSISLYNVVMEVQLVHLASSDGAPSTIWIYKEFGSFTRWCSYYKQYVFLIRHVFKDQHGLSAYRAIWVSRLIRDEELSLTSFCLMYGSVALEGWLDCQT